MVTYGGPPRTWRKRRFYWEALAAIFYGIAVFFISRDSIEFGKGPALSVPYLGGMDRCSKLLVELRSGYWEAFAWRWPPIVNRWDCIQIYKLEFPFPLYGNAFYQFITALQCAHLSRVSEVVVPLGFLSINRPFRTTDGILISVYLNDTTRIERCVGARFHFGEDALGRNWSLVDTFRDGLLAQTQVSDSDEDTLVMWLRGGDIWNGSNVNRDYWQPPAGFYLDVMHQRNWSRVELLSWDDRNPALEVLLAAGAVWSHGTMLKDVGRMLGARNLVLGRGTLGVAVAMLSARLQNLYTFGWASRRFPTHMNCMPTFEFQRIVVARGHQNTEAELAMVRSTAEPCRKWMRIQHNSSSPAPLWYSFG